MSFFTLYVSVLGTIFVLNAIVNTLLKCYEISTRCEPKPQTASSYEHEKDKFARTIPGKWNGDVKQIIEYYPKTNKYKVEFVVPGEKTYIDIIPASYLRGSIPTKMSDLEREFFAKETP